MKLPFKKFRPRSLALASTALAFAAVLAFSWLREGDDQKVSAQTVTAVKPSAVANTAEAGSRSLLLEEALRLEREGRPSEAVGTYEKMVEAQPQDVDGYLRLGAL